MEYKLDLDSYSRALSKDIVDSVVSKLFPLTDFEDGKWIIESTCTEEHFDNVLGKAAFHTAMNTKFIVQKLKGAKDYYVQLEDGKKYLVIIYIHDVVFGNGRCVIDCEDQGSYEIG